MRTVQLTFLCLVALSHARPDKPASPAAREFDAERLEAVLKVLPKISESVKSDGDVSENIRRLTDVSIDIARESATSDDQQKQIDEAAQRTNAILDTVADILKDLPKFDFTDFKTPSIEIPKIVIPKIPEVVIPEFKVRNFQT